MREERTRVVAGRGNTEFDRIVDRTRALRQDRAQHGRGRGAGFGQSEIVRFVLPDLLLVPCVGFDDDGYRLGYGGGFFDRRQDC